DIDIRYWVLGTRYSVLLLAGLLFLAPSHSMAGEYDSLTQHLDLVKHFTLRTSDGKTFEPEMLRGKVWVVHFFFTTCTGVCTKTAPTMAALQKAFAAGKPDIAFVSISLNNDAPDVLERYARGLGADPEQWVFLTGPKEQVHKIVQDVFHQTAVTLENK